MESENQSNAPSLYEFEHAASGEFDPSVRYEAWKATAYHAVDLLPPLDGDQLEASFRFVRGTTGAFGSHQSGRCQTQFTRSARSAGLGECMVINLMAEGTVELDAPDGSQLLVPEGSLAIYDAARLMRYSWSRSKDVYLLLPRPAALRSLGGSVTGLSLSLATSPLAPFLRSQMSLLDRHGPKLSRGELAVMLDSTIAMAMLLLEGLSDRRAVTAEAAMGGLYACALRYLEMNFHRVELDPETMAREIGCSRATLYRAFLARGATIRQSLRDLRLDRARDRLASTTFANLNIASIAFACGFQDSSQFGKQFRARFGASPRDWRAQCSTGHRQGAPLGGRSAFSALSAAVVHVTLRRPDHH